MRIFFLIAYIIPTFTVLTHYLGGAWNYATVALVFMAIPFLDLFLGRDTENPSEPSMENLKKERFFRFVTFFWAPAQYAFIIWAALRLETMTLFEQLGLLLSVGTVNGALGFTIGHELGHRTEKLEQWLAQVLYMSMGYGHFFIEHNLGHHRNVATPEDPATSRLGECFYTFYPRTIIGGWKSAWSIEKRRLNRRNLTMASPRNRMIWYFLAPIVFAILFWQLVSLTAAIFFVAQAILAVSLLELINYIEHYGLLREKNEKGQYVKVQPHHSWNASERLTNFLLFNLQRHSDHHANANRRYQTLRYFKDVPQLPTGYGGMVLLALVPPLWFRIMNPRVEAARAALV